MKIERNTITFSSGRTLRPNRGVVGLSPDLSVFEGYDCGLEWPPYYDHTVDDDPDQPLYTAADMRELADYMILKWSEFRSKLPEGLT